MEFWCSSNPYEIEFARVVVDKWNSARSDIKVKLQPLPASRSTEEALLAAIAARTTPDVCANIYPGVVTQFVAAGGLYRMDSFPDFASFMRERLPDGILEQYRSSDGHYYQAPWKSNPLMLAYNAGMLRAAGVDPASLATYSGFLAAAAKLTRDTNRDGRTDQWMIYLNIEPIWWQRFFDFYTLYAAASGGRTLIESNRAAFNNSAGVAVMQFLSDLFRRGYAPKSAFPGDVFLQQKVATVITGPFAMPFYESMKPKGFEYDFVPAPAPDGFRSREVWTYGDPKNIGIFATSKHPKEAWEFVKFVLSEENDALFLEMTSQIPYRRNLEASSPMRRCCVSNQCWRDSSARLSLHAAPTTFGRWWRCMTPSLRSTSTARCSARNRRFPPWRSPRRRLTRYSATTRGWRIKRCVSWEIHAR